MLRDMSSILPSSALRKFILGPTNTGKTYYAIDRMMSYKSGMIGFPLRLLARENYDKMVARLGLSEVALITGEEKIIPPHACYFCCTIEAMPLEREVDCLVIDEIQLAGDKERGHIFTDRLLHARGRYETLFLGSDTMRPILQKLYPGAEFLYRERFSRLSYAGQKKITRLAPRSAIVAFSANEIYRLAELIKLKRGGAALVMGALSPRTRNAQVKLFENGDVDFMIATDAIGMGLNMDIKHVALADDVKFDGQSMRRLTPAEIGQIAGRAGRHKIDGTFGVTEACGAYDQELIDAIEAHHFAPVRILYWRSRQLNFKTFDGLLASLEALPPYSFMLRKGDGIDHLTLQALAEKLDIRALADSPGRLRLLWDVAQIPDFRRTMTDSHVVMLARIFTEIARGGHLSKDWVSGQLQFLSKLDGDIDTLMARIAHIRTWTYITHKIGWTDDSQDWQYLARSIEDRLSDELHNRLTLRFVDRRVAHLSRRLKEAKVLIAAVRLDGTVLVEGEEVGSLHGFCFVPSFAENEEKAIILSAARKGLPDEIERRVGALIISADQAFSLDERGRIFWRETCIARVLKSDNLYAPRLVVDDNELLTSDQKTRIYGRLTSFIADYIATILAPLTAFANPDHLFAEEEKMAEQASADEQSAGISLAALAEKLETQKAADDLPPPAQLSAPAKGLVYQLYEQLGTMSRRKLTGQINQLSDNDRRLLARAGVRLGTETLFLPAILKPAPIKLRVLLWCLFNHSFFECLPPTEGRVSFSPPEESLSAPANFWMAAGYCRLGPRIIRVDMIERVAALVRAAARQGPFEISDEMLSLAGVGREDMASILIDLGCRQTGQRVAEDPEKPEIALFERIRKKPRPPQKNNQITDKIDQKKAGRRRSNQSKSDKDSLSKEHMDKDNNRRSHKGASAASRQNDNAAINPHSPFAVLAALKINR